MVIQRKSLVQLQRRTTHFVSPKPLKKVLPCALTFLEKECLLDFQECQSSDTTQESKNIFVMSVHVIVLPLQRKEKRLQ